MIPTAVARVYQRSEANPRQQCRHPCEDPEPDPDVLAALLRPVDVEVWHGELHPSDTPLITGSVPVGEERQQDQRMAQEPDPCNTEKGVTACVALEVGEPARACRGVEESSTEHGDAKPQQEMHQADVEPDLECGGKQLTAEEVPDQHAL